MAHVALAGSLILLASLGDCARVSFPAQAPTQPPELASSPLIAATPSPLATASGALLYWASYEFHAEPRFRLILEGGTPVTKLEEVRISYRTGAILASSLTVPVESDPMRLCSRTTRYGTARATIAVAKDLFDGFIRDASGYVVEVRISGKWSHAALANLCHTQQ